MELQPTWCLKRRRFFASFYKARAEAFLKSKLLAFRSWKSWWFPVVMIRKGPKHRGMVTSPPPRHWRVTCTWYEGSYFLQDGDIPASYINQFWTNISLTSRHFWVDFTFQVWLDMLVPWMVSPIEFWRLDAARYNVNNTNVIHDVFWNESPDANGASFWV